LVYRFITWFTEGIFKEDKVTVEREQAAHDAQGGDWNNEVFPPIRDLRAPLARCGVPQGDRNSDRARLSKFSWESEVSR